MHTKNALKNLKNRYKAVLKKCNLLNTFGSLAMVASLLCGSPAFVATSVAGTPDVTVTTEEYVEANANNYTTTYEVPTYDASLGTYITTKYGVFLNAGNSSYIDIDTLTQALITNTTSNKYTDAGFTSIVEGTGTYAFTVNGVTYIVKNGDSEVSSLNTRVTSVITGQVITGNYVGCSVSNTYGAAIYISDSSVTGIRITADFIGNTASSSSTDFSTTTTSGGAIYNSGIIETLSYSTFIGNSSSSSNYEASANAYGGAIYNNGTITTLSNCTFIRNTVSAYGGSNSPFGGAIYNSGTITTLSNNTFLGNTAMRGGAIYNNSTIDTLSNSTFIGNTATSSGGAIYSIGTIDTLSNSTFIGNSSSSGGAIYNVNPSIITTLSYSTFIGNTATSSGGAIYNSGTITTLSNSTFIGNSSSGGAIYTTKGLNFSADDENISIFSDNMAGSEYNAIYVGANSQTLSFTMSDTGSFLFNDGIASGSYTYTMNITGQDSDKNIFYLNAGISGVSDFSINNATLALGSYLHADGNTITEGSISANSIRFDNANLLVDASYYGTNNITPLDGNDTSTLSITNASTLILANATTDTYTIANSFSSATGLWDAESVTVANALLDTVSVSGDAINSAYEVTVAVIPLPDTDTGTDPDSGTNNSIYNTPTAEFLHAIADSELYASDSTNAGARLIYNIMENSDTSTAQKIQIVEGAVQMGAMAGVQTQLASTISSANAVLDTRMLNANSINPSSTAMRVVDENGHVSVYNNITTLASNGYNPLSSPQNYTEMWLMPMYAHEKVSGVSSGNFSNTGYKSDMYGVALGIDRTYQDKYRIGLAFDMGSGNSESNGDYASTENDYDFFGFTAYGSVRFDKLSILGSMGYTKNDSEVAQNLSAYGLNNLYSDIKSDVWNFNLKAEYNYAFGQGYTLSPYVGVQYMSMSTDDYKVKDSNSIGSGDSGSSLGGDTVFNVKSDRQDVFSFPIGVALSKEIHTENGWDFTPKVNAGVIFATGDLYATSVSSIPDIDASSSMSLKVIDSTTLDLGLGLSASKDNFTMMLDYDFQYSEHRTAHGVMGKVVFKF